MKKLHKVEQGKMLCGVCTGIAAYFDIDPTLVRLGWVLFSLLGGLTASMLLGALLLLLADTLGRSAFQPREIPVGIVISVLSAPYFLFLLRRYF